MAIAARPILAADMWPNNTQDDDDNDDIEDVTSHLTPRKLPTNVKAIDNALDGGFEYGAVHCIIPDTDQDARELIQTLLISHLRSSSLATAALVESTSSLDVRRLYQALETVVVDERGGHTAMQTLERLKIMKVFDDVGLTEAVSEVWEGLEKGDASLVGEVDVVRDPATKPPRSTIPDSEDEDEMPEHQDSPEKERQTTKGPLPAAEEQKPKSLLIINNISLLFSPLIKNNYTSGQASLASFMQSLGQVTRSHELCTVLVSNTSNRPASKDDTLSLFGSCTVQPALGVGFGTLLDVLIYLHSLPAKKKEKETDADVQSKTRATVSVLEVIQDRRGSCFGRWAPFARDPQGNLTDIRN